MSGIAKFALNNPEDIKKFTKEVRKAIKTAATQTVNAVAFSARDNLKSYVQSNFNNSNGLTTGDALKVTKAPFGHVENLTDISASVGFTEKVEFMKRQDEGGWHEVKEPQKKLQILTDAAKQGGVPKRKLGKKNRYVYNKGKVVHTILVGMPKQKTPKGRRVARAAMAFKSGMLMYLGQNNSLFKITSFKRVGDKGIKFHAQMYINRKYERTYTRARNFFLPECQKAAQNIQAMFNENMDKQI